MSTLEVGYYRDSQFYERRTPYGAPTLNSGEGAGYHPHEYDHLSNNYGDEAQHKELVNALLKSGIEPVADIVINHRNDTIGWATFRDPNWPARYICCTDEFWSQDPNTMIEEDRQILLKGDKRISDYSCCTATPIALTC